jgi:hypothetical protein
VRKGSKAASNDRQKRCSSGTGRLLFIDKGRVAWKNAPSTTAAHVGWLRNKRAEVGMQVKRPSQYIRQNKLYADVSWLSLRCHRFDEA